MKCQHCEKPATFHITELTDPDDPQELRQHRLAVPGQERKRREYPVLRLPRRKQVGEDHPAPVRVLPRHPLQRLASLVPKARDGLQDLLLGAERLADEMGLYTDATTRLGILSFDSWRAARLVVDTGIHSLGWSRQQAIDWLSRWTPIGPLTIAQEVDRYIGMPGQALSYMIGRLEIMRMRSPSISTVRITGAA